jgi:hypothetical protein
MIMQESTKAIKQILDFNKNTFDSGLNVMMNISEQNEKMFRSLMDQASWMPDEGKKLVFQWSDLYRKGFEDFKKAADENYKTVVEYLESTGSKKQK